MSPDPRLNELFLAIGQAQEAIKSAHYRLEEIKVAFTKHNEDTSKLVEKYVGAINGLEDRVMVIEKSLEEKEKELREEMDKRIRQRNWVLALAGTIIAVVSVVSSIIINLWL